MSEKTYNFSALLLALLLLLHLSGCQLNQQQQPVRMDLYYLNMKALSADQLSTELAFIKSDIRNDVNLKNTKLAIIHAIPNTQIHNPYTAKAYLNQVDLKQLDSLNLAFLTVLRDQLNLQIGQLNQQQTMKKSAKQLAIKHQEMQREIEALSIKIEQLKRIESTIQDQKL